MVEVIMQNRGKQGRLDVTKDHLYVYVHVVQFLSCDATMFITIVNAATVYYRVQETTVLEELVMLMYWNSVLCRYLVESQHTRT